MKVKPFLKICKNELVTFELVNSISTDDTLAISKLVQFSI